MTWETPQFSITDARAAEQDVYDVLVSKWGATGITGADFQFPPVGQPGIDTSLAGLAIGPRSTVDRCFVTWNLQKVLPPAATPGSIRRLSVESPLMFGMPAKPGSILSTNDTVQAMSQGNLYIFPKTTAASFSFPDLQDSTITPTGYKKAFPSAGLPVIEPFGPGATPGVFLAPFLHLVLYLRAPFLPPPTKRLPLVSRGAMDALPAATETCVAQIPTYGRKHIVLQIESNKTSDFRVGALRALAVVGGTQPLESPEASATGVTALVDTRFQLDNPNADYVMLYCTPTAIANVKFVISAYD